MSILPCSRYVAQSKIGNLKSKINGVVDGTRTRNNQDHNLGLYH